MHKLKHTLKIFNYTTNTIIKSLSKYNLDEHTIIYLSKKTKKLLSFTQKIIIKLLFKILESTTFLKNKITHDLIDIDRMIDITYEQIIISLNNINKQKNYETKKEDIDNIIENLTILKNLINTLSNLAISVLKFQADIISEDELRNEYRTFKTSINKYKII